MSKVFSLSLATLMVFVSLFSSVQPNVAADVATPEPAPVEESAVSMEVDQDEAVEEPTQETPTQPAEPTEIIEEDAPPAPADEPAEDANAPPADEPLVEEPTEVATEVATGDPADIATEAATEEAPAATDVPTEAAEITPAEKDAASEIEAATEEPIKIVPNAVDPNPGDCPVEEICDGGGGETPQTVTVTITVTQSGNLSGGATVVVKSASNAEVGTKVTGANGNVEFELTVGTTYLVDVSKTGYVTQTGVSFVASGESTSLNINLLPAFGKVNVTVTDSVTGEPVRYAIVRFTGKSGTNFVVNTNSGSTGQISVSMNSGEYVAFFSHADYVSQQFDATVTVGDSISVQLVPEVQEPVPTVLSLEVRDKATGDPVPNAMVTLRMPTGSFEVVSEGSTDANGRWDSSPVENVDYELIIFSPSHTSYFERITSIPTSVRTIELDSGPELTATYTVLDLESNEPIENAFITVKDYYSDTQVAAGQTDATGNWTFNPILGNGYWVTIEKDGYQASTTYTYVSKAYSQTVHLMTPGYPGSIVFDILEDSSTLGIPGATITMSNGEVTETLLTDDSGRASLESVASGTYDITIEANGYTTYVGTVKISPNRTINATYQLEPRPAATLVVQLQAPVEGSQMLVTNLGLSTTFGTSGFAVNQVSGAMVPVAGGRVQLVNPDTGLVIAEGVTDADGLVTIPVVRQGTYQLNVSVAGYEDYSAPYTITQDTEQTITLQPLGSTNPDVPGNPTDPEPGDGDGQTPTNPEPGDGDGQMPTNPEPGDGDGQTPTNPQPGDSDDQAPTSPAPGTDGGVETPADPSPVDGGTGPVTPGETETPATDSSVAPDAVAQADGESSNASGTGTAGTESAARVQAESVTDLPSTGSGPAQSNGMFSTLFILAGVILILAAVPSRRTR